MRILGLQKKTALRKILGVMMLAFHKRLCINILAFLRQLGTAVLLKTYLYFLSGKLNYMQEFLLFFFSVDISVPTDLAK